MAAEQISNAVHRLSSKLHELNLEKITISEYNRQYLKRYIDQYSFYMSIYSQLFSKAISRLNKPISESVFVDYGGGCGMLSYMAFEMGFKKVIYNDIYPVSVADVKMISNTLGIKIDHFIEGDIEAFVHQAKKENIKPDLICSFDVLEHIYDLEKWFHTIAKIEHNFSLLFMTNANASNPIIARRLKKLQIKAENEGLPKNKGWKEIDESTSFLALRKNIISSKFPELGAEEIGLLSVTTRGLRKEDIEKVVKDYIKTGEIGYRIDHPTNTCDPFTGNWTEHLIDLKHLKAMIIKNSLLFDISNSYYGYSKNKMLNLPKFLINQFIKMLGKRYLFLSPTYTIEIQKESFKT